MKKETIIKEALKCYNRDYFSCKTTYETKNEVCLWCLDNLVYKNKKAKKPDNSTETPNKAKIEISIPEFKIKKFRFPIDLIEFPLTQGSIVERSGKTLDFYLKGYYGDYCIETFRNPKLMDYRTFLIVLYLANYNQNPNYEEKFTNWIKLLEVKDTGFYREAILDGLEYLKKTTFYTPYIFDLEMKNRPFKVVLNENGEVDFHNLPNFSVWSILNSFHHLKEKGKRKTKIKVELNKDLYKRMVEQKYFTLVDIEKILPLKDIALNLYLFIKRQNPKNIENYIIDFETLKAHIGITDKHITNSRLTFENALNDIKDSGLLKGYRHRIYISKKDNREYIRFIKVKSLTS